MKRTFAILMLIIHLFNLGGFMALNQYLVYRSDRSASEQIKRGKYDATNLIEIKIPQHMPQIKDWDKYESISGQVQLNGFAYNYVKLKVTRDTLFIQSIPNYETTRLLTQNIISAKLLGDLPLDKKSHESPVKKSGIDYLYNYPVFTYTLTNKIADIQKTNTFVVADIDHPFIPIDGRPPEVIA